MGLLMCRLSNDENEENKYLCKTRDIFCFINHFTYNFTVDA